MRFHYVPSTYRGRKFGKGYYGGSYMGYGRICGGSLADLGFTKGKINALINAPVNVPVNKEEVLDNIVASAPPKLTPELIERAKKIIAYAEATGKAQPITKKEAGFWSGLKNLGSKAWNATKAVGKTALKGAWTATKYGVPFALNAAEIGIPMAMNAATFATTNPFGRAILSAYEPQLKPLIKKYVPKKIYRSMRMKLLDEENRGNKYWKDIKRMLSTPNMVKHAKNFRRYLPSSVNSYVNLLDEILEEDSDPAENRAKSEQILKELKKEEQLKREQQEPLYGPTNTAEEIKKYYKDHPNPDNTYNENEIEEVSDDEEPIYGPTNTAEEIEQYNKEHPQPDDTYNEDEIEEVSDDEVNDKDMEEERKRLLSGGWPRETVGKKLKEKQANRDLTREDLYKWAPLERENDIAIDAIKSGAKWLWNKGKSWLGFGSGYRRRRRGRFKKGSILARTYMAYLRALRGLKKRSRRGGMLPKALWGSVPNFRGSGCSGGMFRGVSVKDLQKYYDTVKANIIPGSRKINIEWKDAKGNKKTTTTTKQKLHNMLIGTERMKNYFSTWERNEKGKLRKLKKERSPEEQKKLKGEDAKNHNRMKLRWPYKKMTQKRLKEILRTFKSMEFQKLKDYWRPRLVASKNRKFYNRWFSYNYFNKDDPKNERAGYFPKKGNSRNVRDLISVVRLNRFKKEGKYKSELIPDDVNDLVIRLSENAIVGFKKDPSVGSPK